MKKFGFVVLTMLAGLSAVGCGSSACDDYATKAKDCLCASLTDATAKSTCEKNIDTSVDAFKNADGADDACKAANDTLTTTCK